MSYSVAERYVMTKIWEYGGGVDWGGAGAARAYREAAKKLIDRGLVQGSYRNSSLTAKGVKAVLGIERRKKAKAKASFDRDRKAFER